MYFSSFCGLLAVFLIAALWAQGVTSPGLAVATGRNTFHASDTDGANGNAGSNLAGSVAESGSGGNGSTLRSAAAAVERSVGLLLQLTDIHISAMAGPAGDPQRASDLVSLASGLLARWPVAAALLTGDITEAKDVYGSGRQDEREWRMYRDARTALSSIGRVPYNQIYDIRGNHDTFNSGPRCGAEDWYCTYSARAERFGQGGANGTSGTADRGPQARIFIDAVYGSTDGGNGVGGGSACPVAMVVGVDASLDPGMRSPTNFLGVITQSVLDELDEQLAASIAGMRGANCNPPYIAYGHYPLSTIAYPGRRIAGGAAERAASVHQILVRHGVSAYLAGHLHGAFGRKLHRLHAGPIAGTGAADDNPRGHMLELEMVDWKYARTVRLLTVDPGPGGAVGFADFQFIPPRVGNVVAGNHLAEGRVTHKLEPFDDTCAIGTYLPLITCPPDARYSPQLAAVYTSAGGCSIGGSADNGDFGGGKAAVTAVVRVMLLPMSPAVPAVPSGTVYLQWSCDAVGANEVGWGVDFGDAGGGSSRPGGTGAHDPRQQHQQQPQGDESSSPAVTSSGAHGNSSNWRNRDRRLQQGAYQMRLESATANYSIFTVDLLGAEGGEFPGAESSFGSSSSDSVYSCPSGYIVVQAVVGVGRRNSSNDDASVESASAKRLLHWQLPPSQPTPSLRPSSPRRSLFESAGARGRDGMDGGMDSGVFPSGQVTPVPLQQTTLEWLVMHVPWHSFGLIAFVAQWCILTLGLLLAPRVVAVLKPHRTLRHRPRQGPGMGRHHRQRRSGPVPDSDGYGSGEELETELVEPVPLTAAVAGTTHATAANRQLDWAGEGASTSIWLSGGNSGRSTPLKRNSSGSNSGCGGGRGTREGHAGGADVWSSSLAAVPAPAVSRSLLGLLFYGGNGAAGPVSVRAAGNGRTVAIRFWHMALGCILWPLRDLAELAEHRDSVPWLALFLYCLYLVAGPWLVAGFVGRSGDDRDAEPKRSGYGVLTAYGIYMWSPSSSAPPVGAQAGWSAAPSQDHAVIINVVTLVCVAPGVLLCSSLAARVRRLAAGGSLGDGFGGANILQVLSWRQALALCCIAVLNFGLCWKLWAGLGWAPVLLSPGVGWLLPLLVAWLWMTASRARATSQQCRH